MKKVIEHILFALFYIMISPYLIITGAIVRCKRFYRYVMDVSDGKEPKKYLW